MISRASSAALALLTAALTMTATPTISSAEPGDHPIALASLGLGRSLEFPGQTHEVSLNLPVLPGLAPTAIVGTVQQPPNVARAVLDAHTPERFLDRVPLPPDPRAPVRISLLGAEVRNNTVAVTLTSSLVPEPGVCLTDWLGRPTTLSDVAVIYSGEEMQPSMVSDFLPPVLERLTVYVSSNPSQVESAAVLALSTAAIARYAGQSVALDIRRIDSGTVVPDHVPAFLERQIVIKEESDAGLRLVGGPAPVLTISGDEKSMPTQIQLLTSDLAKAAMAGSATALGLPAVPQLAPDNATLLELGQSRLSATSIGEVRVNFAIDQTRLGRPAQDLRINVRGNHTPLPNTLNGQLAVTVGDRQIGAWPAEASGSFNQWVTIPNKLLSRFTTVSVTLQQAGLIQSCGLEQPVTLTVDPTGEVQSTSANPPIPAGLGALPQALLPRVRIGLQTPGFADTVRAAQVLVAVQRLTSVPLRPELVSFDTAVHGTLPAVLIATNGGTADVPELPLARRGETLTVYGDDAYLKSRIDLTPPIDFGTLQATWADNRMVVVANSTEKSPEHLDRLLNWLIADPDRSFQLTGPVLLQAGNREPEFFDPAAPLAAAAAAQAATDSEIPLAGKLAIAGGSLLALGALAGVLILLQRRRSR